MLRRSGALILLGLAACAANVTPEVSPATPLAPPPAPAPRRPPSASRLRPLFGDATAPAPFEAAAKLSWGMALDQARKAAPTLFGETPYHPPGFADVALSGEGDIHGRLAALVMVLPRATALADVTNLWGEPVKAFDRGAKVEASWWFNPAARVRARLEETGRLVLERYFPAAELFGNPGERLGFEKESLIGMKGVEAAAAYRDYVPPDVGAKTESANLCQTELLVLPPVEHDTTPTRVRVRCGTEAVISFEVKVRHEGHPALKDEIMRHLRRKFGPPADKTDIMGRAVVEYAGASRRVRLLDDESVREVTLTVMGRASRGH